MIFFSGLIVSLKSGTVVELKYFIFNCNMKNVNMNKSGRFSMQKKECLVNGTQGVSSSLLSRSSLCSLLGWG